MSASASKTIDFVSPTASSGGVSGCPSRRRPVDLVHLARQTGGDRVLEGEILALMLRQINVFSGRLRLGTEAERRHVGHALKGAARGVGAFALAEMAGMFEAEPMDEAVIHAFELEMERTAVFIGSLQR